MAKQKVEKVAPPFLRLREEQSWEKSWKNSFRNERIFGGEVFQASRATLTTRRCNVMVYKHRARVISGPNCYVLDDVSERTRFDDEKIPHECNISFEREREIKREEFHCAPFFSRFETTRYLSTFCEYSCLCSSRKFYIVPLIIHVIDIKATLIRKIALYPLSPNDQLRERC